jgi:hypothetical protein
MRNPLWLAPAGLLFVLLAAPVGAESYSPRQYYGPIQKHPKYNYSYRPYYYKPTPKYVGYKHQYVLYYPSKPKYAYFYNPYKKQFWGRCPANSGGKGSYSMLAPKDRKPRIEDVEEDAFPKPKEVPDVPESEDGVKMDLPPDDLPGSSTLPGS